MTGFKALFEQGSDEEVEFFGFAGGHDFVAYAFAFEEPFDPVAE